MKDDNITKIGIGFKKPVNEEKMLTLIPSYHKECREHAYIIDAEASKVTCSKCEKTFNPMSVLVDLARKESQWMMNGKRYTEEMKRLDERSRTKCKKCGEITKISRN